MPEFLGLPCVELKNEALSLLVTTTVGPRILSLRIHGGENLFAEVPDFTLECPGAGKCHLWGGHRFWVAPEDPPTTYMPENKPLVIHATSCGLQMTQPVMEPIGLQKSLRVQFSSRHPEETGLELEHVLTNRASRPIECAPWAITQLKPGGFAILTLSSAPQGDSAVLSDRQISLWPYTEMRSPHIDWGNDWTFVHANMTSGALKLGFSSGSLSYFRNRTLFRKANLTQHASPRFGRIECYCNPSFLELETVGPIRTLEPGESVVHSESWTVYDDEDLEPTEASIRADMDTWDR